MLDGKGWATRPEWKPKTYGDLWKARRAVIDILRRIASANDAAAVDARGALVDSVFTLIREGLRGEAIDILETASPSTDQAKRHIIDTAQRILRYNGESLSTAERERLLQLTAQTFGSSYFDRLKRWAGPRLLSDFETAEQKGFEKAETATRELAEEGFKSGLSETEIAWLSSPEAENSWIFGKRLGEVDVELKYLDEIVRATPENINCVFLSGYLAGHASTAGNSSREHILDDLAQRRPLLAFGATWRGAPSQLGARRVISLITSKRVPANNLGMLMYGGWVEELPKSEAIEILEMMLVEAPAETVEAAMSVIIRLSSKDEHALDDPDIQDIAWRTLQVKGEGERVIADWEWAEIAERLAARDPKRLVKLLLQRFESDESFYLRSDTVLKPLQSAIRVDPRGVFEVVGPALLVQAHSSFKLLLSLEKWFGDQIPIDVLLAWARENQPRGPLIAVRLISIGDPLSDRAKAIVHEFGDQKAVFNAILANAESGSWVGPASSHAEAQLAMIRNWAQDPEPSIRNWAATLIPKFEAEVRRQKQFEEEQEFT